MRGTKFLLHSSTGEIGTLPSANLGREHAARCTPRLPHRVAIRSLGALAGWGVSDVAAAESADIGDGAVEHAPGAEVGDGMVTGTVRAPSDVVLGLVQNPDLSVARSPGPRSSCLRTPGGIAARDTRLIGDRGPVVPDR